MGHLTYPNATHTRFAHSLGVFGIMCRVIERIRKTKEFKAIDLENLRLAALLHDIGHYPYSHLMERVDGVKLTEDAVCSPCPPIPANQNGYPGHEALGRHILYTQKDLVDAVGGEDRAREIGNIFSREGKSPPELSKLIHSSLDMDRLDYLLRDSRATGVPYGEIDINYLLGNIRLSPNGILGVDLKALAAAEHFLLARLFMTRTVYYHKTTFGLEEACRQLLRRLRDSGRYSMPAGDQAIKELCAGQNFSSFTDDFIDRLVREAAQDENPIINSLAKCITNRRPPRLIHEVSGLQKRGEAIRSDHFRGICRARLEALAAKFDLPVGQFLLCSPKPIEIEERGHLFTREEAENLPPKEREELIRIFVPGEDEPKPMVEIKGSLINQLAGHQFGITRLYLVDGSPGAETRFKEIKAEVGTWM